MTLTRFAPALIKQYVYAHPEIALDELRQHLKAHMPERDQAEWLDLVDVMLENKVLVMSDDVHVDLSDTAFAEADKVAKSYWPTTMAGHKCSACVPVPCVCNGSLVCIDRGTGHSTGCHGSHD